MIIEFITEENLGPEATEADCLSYKAFAEEHHSRAGRGWEVRIEPSMVGFRSDDGEEVDNGLVASYIERCFERWCSTQNQNPS